MNSNSPKRLDDAPEADGQTSACAAPVLELERTDTGNTSSRHSLWKFDPTTVRRIAFLIIYSAAIIYFGTRRSLVFPGDEILSNDKVLHAVAFGGLAVLAFRFCRHFWPSMSSPRVVSLSVGFSILLGATLELIQSRLPYRSMEFADLVADSVGAMLCVAAARHFHLERSLLSRWS